MQKRPGQARFTTYNLLGDTFGIVLSFLFSYIVRFYSFLPIAAEKIPAFSTYSKTLIVVIPCYILCFRIYGLYSTARHIRRIEEIFLVIKAITLAIVLLTAASFFYREISYSRLVLVCVWIFSIFFVSAFRYLVIQLEYKQKKNSKEVSRALLIGANRNSRNIIQWARNNPHYGVEVFGILAHDSESVQKHFEDVSILGKVDDCEKFITETMPNQVILLDHDFTRERITELVNLCENQMIDFKLGADFYGLMSRNVDVEYLSTVPLIGFRRLPLDDPWNRFLKRSFDVISSAILLLITSPLWLTICCLVRLTSPGPILFRQKRMGRDQKVFNVLKFRTMTVNAEAETGPVWAAANDSRKTAVGTFLRRWNLDELPQLFNVLRGDMSMVGPRPERPHFIEEFSGTIPRYMARHKIRSGLTGWAAVNGYRGNTSIVERTKYDLYYMENWSLLFDLEILIMTGFAFRNAY